MSDAASLIARWFSAHPNGAPPPFAGSFAISVSGKVHEGIVRQSADRLRIDVGTAVSTILCRDTGVVWQLFHATHTYQEQRGGSAVIPPLKPAGRDEVEGESFAKFTQDAPTADGAKTTITLWYDGDRIQRRMQDTSTRSGTVISSVQKAPQPAAAFELPRYYRLVT